MTTLDDDLEELVSAEDFLDYFKVEYKPELVYVNRLHILQRYHDYLGRAASSMPEGEDARRELHRALLVRAYQDFVESTAIDERVFKVLKDAVGQGFVPLTAIEGGSKV